MVHSCCVICGFRQKYNDIYFSLYYYTKQFHCPKNPQCSAYSYFLPTSLLVITGFLIVFIVLSFPEYHIVGIVQYVTFSDWLLLLSYIPLKLLHAFSWPDNSYHFSTNISLYGNTTACLLIPLLKDTLVTSTLAIISKAAINIHVQAFAHTF